MPPWPARRVKSTKTMSTKKLCRLYARPPPGVGGRTFRYPCCNGEGGGGGR